MATNIELSLVGLLEKSTQSCRVIQFHLGVKVYTVMVRYTTHFSGIVLRVLDSICSDARLPIDFAAYFVAIISLNPTVGWLKQFSSMIKLNK